VIILSVSLPELASTLGAPMYALPVDIFRIFSGFVGLEYFRRAFVQTPDSSSPDGLIDHEMSQRLFPPTRLSLFQPGVPIGVLRSVFLLACFASILVIFGHQTKAAEVVLPSVEGACHGAVAFTDEHTHEGPLTSELFGHVTPSPSGPMPPRFP